MTRVYSLKRLLKCPLGHLIRSGHLRMLYMTSKRSSYRVGCCMECTFWRWTSQLPSHWWLWCHIISPGFLYNNILWVLILLWLQVKHNGTHNQLNGMKLINPLNIFDPLSVENQPIICYINGSMFGFQSLLYTVCFHIHKGNIWTSTLRILVSLFDIP